MSAHTRRGEIREPQLAWITRLARRRAKLERELEEAIVQAHVAGYSVRRLAEAADLGHGTVHRILVRSRS